MKRASSSLSSLQSWPWGQTFGGSKSCSIVVTANLSPPSFEKSASSVKCCKRSSASSLSNVNTHSSLECNLSQALLPAG
jgi:hypothetical protein